MNFDGLLRFTVSKHPILRTNPGKHGSFYRLQFLELKTISRSVLHVGHMVSFFGWTCLNWGGYLGRLLSYRKKGWRTCHFAAGAIQVCGLFDGDSHSATLLGHRLGRDWPAMTPPQCVYDTSTKWKQWQLEHNTPKVPLSVVNVPWLNGILKFLLLISFWYQNLLEVGLLRWHLGVWQWPMHLGVDKTCHAVCNSQIECYMIYVYVSLILNIFQFLWRWTSIMI